MNNDNSANPELRFPEFKDDWNKDILGNISKINKGFTPSTSNKEYWENGTYPWLSIADMKTKYLSDTQKKITKEGTNNKPPIEKDKLVMSFKLSIGKLGILNKPMYTNEAIANFDWKNEDISTEFMYYYLNSINILKYGSQAAKGITLNNETLSSIPVKFPSFSEQEKISKFLKSIDKKIELIERELFLNQQLEMKLSEMLFNNIENNCEFFTVKDIFKVVPSKKYQINHDEIQSSGKIPVVTQGKDKSGFCDDFSKICEITPLILFGDHTTKIQYIDFPFIVGGDGVKLLRPNNEKMDVKFLYHVLKNYNVNQEGYKRHFSILKGVKLPIPSNFDQRNIVQTLDAFENKINLLLNFSKELKYFKKGLLQKMF